MTPSRDLLVLYTGGTLGMQPGAGGLVPAGGFEARLRAEQARRGGALPAWRVEELSPPLDSANMTPRHWLRMRDAIVAAVEHAGCGGVLVLHGTDTLAYSAAALSFLLLGLPVPVVLTGAMHPAGVPGSDAWPNLFGALEGLGAGRAAGVQLYFAGRWLPGTRVTKRSSEALDAFQASARPLGGPRGEVPAALDYRCRRRPVQLAVQPLFPGLGAASLRALLASGVEGLVLECYGSGTGPADDEELLAVLGEARRRGVVLAAISQCPEGRIDFSTYAAGSRLAACGLLDGGGMTREAALGKLFALIGAGLDADAVGDWFARDLCGERAG